MNTFETFCLSFGAVHTSGLYSPEGHRGWEKNQSGPDDVTRGQILDHLHTGFGKMSLPDRLSFSSASLALRSLSLENDPNAGIVIGLPSGSLSTDMRYVESLREGYPSPAVFSSTLPSSALAEIAIFHKLKGTCRVIGERGDSGLGAIDHACRLLRIGKLQRVVAVITYAVEKQDRGSSLTGTGTPPANASFGFVLGKKPHPATPTTLLEGTWGCKRAQDSPETDDVYFHEVIQLLTKRKSGSVRWGPHDSNGVAVEIKKDV